MLPSSVTDGLSRSKQLLPLSDYTTDPCCIIPYVTCYIYAHISETCDMIVLNNTHNKRAFIIKKNPLQSAVTKISLRYFCRALAFVMFCKAALEVVIKQLDEWLVGEYPTLKTFALCVVKELSCNKRLGERERERGYGSVWS